MILVFLSTASFLSILIIFRDVVLSKPEVGSSQSKKLGSVINSYPIDVLFLSPPESPFTVAPPIIVSLQFSKDNLSTISSIFLSIYLSVNYVLSLAANLNDSAGVKVSKRTSSYCTKAPNLPKSLSFISLSLHLSSPSNFDPGESPSL